VKSPFAIANYFAGCRSLSIAHFQLPIVSQGAGRWYCQPMIALYLRDNWQLEMGDGQIFLIMDFDPLFW
jgi:hypothetical protein